MAQTYELNAYFGIFYPDQLIDTVLGICAENARFAPLANDDVAELSVDKTSTLIVSTNSDSDCSIGFIAVDEMTIGSKSFRFPGYADLNIEPAEMEKLELKHATGTNALTDLYDILVAEFKTRGLSVKKLHIGWKVMDCVWDESSSEHEQPAECAPAPRGQKK